MEKQTMTKPNKNAYLRFLLKLLHTKYHVNISSLGRDFGFKDTTFRVFYAGSRNFTENDLEILEDHLIDLYGALLDIDIALHQPMINRWLVQDEEQISLF